MDQDSRHGQWGEAIRQVVREASDEQLEGMIGPDRRFYSDDAIVVAEAELEARRKGSGAQRAGSFNTAAMALGPVWYFYNGMIGRGLVLAAVLLGAALGLAPIVGALGLPPTAWAVAVVVAVAVYSGVFGERDLAESRTQARAARPGSRAAGREREPSAGGSPAPPAEPPGERAPRGGGAEPEAVRTEPPLAVVAQVGCRAAAERTRELLRTHGIDALVTTSKSEPGGLDQTRVLVPRAKLVRARSMIQSFLGTYEADCTE